MKKLVLLAALTALSACSQKAAESRDAAATPTETAAPAPTANPGTAPGSYDVKLADGTVASTVINADGTYVDTDATGKTVKKGKFAHKDGEDCFDPDGDEAEECWTLSPAAADGSFTATNPEGTTVTVTPKKS
ncbi:hypothetical protein SKP52_11170 [Sphingopyxis fribergensis]|uniref:Secreted protein n=1 Tax=Sphingopyxis fribergensis TaxID=1515612 RepID=A0A0A7PGP1_9SPHN|nr:hypothetical protein [Sphingopyxis fribergensis]AJA09134.1 hypothetical protein SKP52_11170 [Sphingopyxis fribergensis]